MARVPISQDSVRADPLQTGYFQPQSDIGGFGGLSAQALQTAGSAVQKSAEVFSAIEEDMRVREDQSIARKADVDYAKRIEAIRQDFMTKQGQNAIEAHKSIEKRLKDERAEVEKSITNDRQRNYFTKMADTRALSAQHVFNGHAMAQTRAFEEETASARVSNQLTEAANNSGNRQAALTAIGVGRAEVEQAAIRNGWSEDVLKNRIEKYESQAYAGVILSRINAKDNGSAQSWFSAYKDKLTPEVRDRVQKHLEEGNLRARAQAATDAITNSGLDHRTAIDQAKSIKDGKLRDEVYQRVNQHFDLQKKLQQESQAEADKKGLDIMQENLNNKLGASARDGIPVDVWNAMSTSGKNAVINNAKSQIRGERKESDFNTEYALRSMSDQDLAKFDIRTVQDKLTNAHRTEFLKKQQEIKKKGPTPDTQNIQQQISASMVAAGFSKKDSPERYAQVYNNVHSLLYQENKRRALENKPAMKQLERQDYVTELLRGDNTGFFSYGNNEVVKYLGTKDEGKAIRGINVPQEYLDKIKKDIAAYNIANPTKRIPETEDMYRAMYLKNKLKISRDVLKKHFSILDGQ